jgi:hypothetical protein
MVAWEILRRRRLSWRKWPLITDSPYVETAKESLKKLMSETVPTGKFNKCVGDEPYLYVEDRIMEKTVETPIMMCNAKDLASMDLDWSYNASVLKIINVTTVIDLLNRLF